MNRKNLVLTAAVLLSIIFVASALLPALAQLDNFYVLMENRTDETVRFQVAWTNTYDRPAREWKRYSIPPHDSLFFENEGDRRMLVKTSDGVYKCDGIKDSMGARYAFKYDQDNVVVVRLK